ncbi:hypothetical protein ACFWM1_17200 [Nocardia sp. NPDC058379]|uniref:hypothetical protein n=1 Tax=unclassified Nocardia TaxID=2637762 RepID=UPI003655381E
MTAASCPAPDGDVHVRIWLADMAFDYTAAAVAARNLLLDRSRKHWCAIEVTSAPADDLRLWPRLPCERLFLLP